VFKPTLTWRLVRRSIEMKVVLEKWQPAYVRYPVRVRVENPSPELFRVGESAVVILRGR
jgi:hypothetical protein